MTLDQLRIFIAVADREHLTGAAEALNMTPSAVSHAIRALEERHGAELFHRVGRRIELAEAGRVFLPAAKATLAQAQSAELALAELGGMKRGRLAVHASQTIASYWVPELLVRFHDAYPGVYVSLAVGNTTEAVRAVVEGSADVGFVEGDVDEPVLAMKSVASDQLIVVVSPDHHWADGRLLKPDDLRHGRWVMREQGSGTRALFEDALEAIGIPRQELDVSLSLPSNEAVRAAVQAGKLAGVMSEMVAANDLEAGRLARAGIDLPARMFWMLWHKERYRTKAARALEALIPKPSRENPAQRSKTPRAPRH
ncbi:LysR substrate-binding domain-containing protein [Flaviflagellibacter deserti]|jgi:DNA-binding transcriptional LysR family regulator|uniref:LysR substrate-binding domain-containing protein n=1 Tax=Flaviflagellibacter deserti TaxID=2267266 RepID=A0ABV9Z2M0_9HYPH